jgi:hypothetical protein
LSELEMLSGCVDSREGGRTSGNRTRQAGRRLRIQFAPWLARSAWDSKHESATHARKRLDKLAAIAGGARLELIIDRDGVGRKRKNIDICMLEGSPTRSAGSSVAVSIMERPRRGRGVSGGRMHSKKVLESAARCFRSGVYVGSTGVSEWGLPKLRRSCLSRGPGCPSSFKRSGPNPPICRVLRVLVRRGRARDMEY